MSGQGTFPLMVNPLVNEGEDLSDDEEELTSGWPETDVSTTSRVCSRSITLHGISLLFP